MIGVDFECIIYGAPCLNGKSFCCDECEEEYYYENRICDTCGGEFWDVGTTCTCDDEY